MQAVSSRYRSYPGRLIVDHLPKTAGMAVADWLRRSLGAGCVTENLSGKHRDFIRRYGGAYSIISGHLAFNGEGLDPRYQYITCLRDPLDRALSHLYFVLNNHGPGNFSHLPGHERFWEEINEFVESGGDAVSLTVRHFLSDPYVRHFSSVSHAYPEELGAGVARMAAAKEALEQYDLVGFFEDIPAFVTALAAMIGVEAPAELAAVNKTKDRLSAGDIPDRLRSNILALIELDVEFYDWARQRFGDHAGADAPAQRGPWHILEATACEPARRASSAFRLLDLSGADGMQVLKGGMLTFSLHFELLADVEDLEIGVGAVDAAGEMAWGTNSTMLGERMANVAAGAHVVRYTLVADFPPGRYDLVFAFNDRSGGRVRELAWFERLGSFSVTGAPLCPGIGYRDTVASILIDR